MSEEQQRWHGRCEKVCACDLEKMQLVRGVQSVSFGESEEREVGGELWTSNMWHHVERSMMRAAEAEFSGLWK